MPRRNFPLRTSAFDGWLLGGCFEILGLLARGGTSKVYLARDRRNRKFVAVKWLSANAAKDPQHLQRFLVGGKAVLGIDHPGIAQVHAVMQPDDVPPYLVMEALEGEPLTDYLERQQQPDNDFALMLAREVAGGLAAAHDAGIVHRDIKPGNLFLVGPVGAPSGVKIIDFGFSKDINEDTPGPDGSNVVLGTAQYMAPEQVIADPVDWRADIYAFGVVLFRVLTGQLPFDLDPSLELLEHQLFSPVPPVSWLNDTVDGRLEKLVHRCLRKNPEDRYPSMHDLLEDLERITSSHQDEQPASLRGSPKRERDIYRPRHAAGLEVAQSMAAHFGVEPPTQSTVSSEPLGRSVPRHSQVVAVAGSSIEEAVDGTQSRR